MPSTTTGTDVLLYLMLSVAALSMGAGTLAWLFGNSASTFTGAGSWVPYEPTDALLHPHQVWPHLPQPVLVGVCYILPALVLLAATLLGVKVWLRLRGNPEGLADQRDLADLMPKKIASKAVDLRPSLKGT